MNLRIKGKYLLDANSYERILIKGDNESININVTGNKSKRQTEMTTYKFSDSLVDKTPEQKICDVVDYFLSDHRVNFLKDGSCLARQEGKFIIVKTTRNLTLALNLPKRDKLNSIPSMIINKYLFDRMRFCEENKDINKVEVHLSDIALYKKDKLNSSSYISLSLCVVNDGFKDAELSFLKDFILDRCYTQGQRATINNNGFYSRFTDNYIVLDNYLKCGDFILEIKSNSPNFKKYLGSIVDEYNSELEKNKKKQLRMEGF